MVGRVDIARLVSAAAAAMAWLWFVSGGFHADGILDGYYELQAQSLMQGRLSIGPGPFDLFIHDAAIHGGQCYSAYGLFPSVLLILTKASFGRFLAHYVIVFGFFFALAFFFQKLIAQVIDASGASESEPRLLIHLSSIVLGCLLLFLVPLPGVDNWFFGRFVIYEQQVVFSVALAVPGSYYLLRAVRERRIDLFALAAVLFSVAAWTKITWFAMALICTVAGLCVTFFPGWSYKSRAARVMTVLGLILGVAPFSGRLLINWAEFGSMIEFGTFLMNPSSAEYLRNQAPLFSPLTRLGNAAFMMLSFYGSPKLATVSAVWNNSFALWEDMAPCFFATNPWFLLLAALVPVGLFVSRKKRPAMFRALLVMLGVTLYVNGIMAFFGLAVTKRYFMEGYYFLIVLLFGALLVFTRLRYAVVILLLCIGIQARTTIVGFSTVTPELRVLDVQQDYRVISAPATTPFIVRNGSWPKEFISAANVSYASPCAVMGMQSIPGGRVSAMDVCAAYLSLEAGAVRETPARVSINGAEAVSGGGTWLIFVDEKLVGSMTLHGETGVAASFDLPFSLKREAPYRILGVFLPDQARYLAGRPSEEPVVTFRGMSLEPLEGER